MIEQKESKTQKIKVISLYEETPKQFLNPTPKVKNYPKIKSANLNPTQLDSIQLN